MHSAKATQLSWVKPKMPAVPRASGVAQAGLWVAPGWWRWHHQEACREYRAPAANRRPRQDSDAVGLEGLGNARAGASEKVPVYCELPRLPPRAVTMLKS